MQTCSTPSPTAASAGLSWAALGGFGGVNDLCSPIGTSGGAFETRVFVIRNISLGETVAVIQPLLPAEAVLSTVEGSGLLILSDRKENISRIEALVRQLDQPRRKTIETIRLNYSSAQDLLSTIQALEIVPPGASVTADFRSNAIVVSGNDEFRNRVRAVVNQLDTPFI